MDKDNRSRGESSGERTLVQLEEDEDGLLNRKVDHHSVVIHPHFSEYALCRPTENQEWLHTNNNIVIMQFPTFVSSSGAPWAYREKGISVVACQTFVCCPQFGSHYCKIYNRWGLSVHPRSLKFENSLNRLCGQRCLCCHGLRKLCWHCQVSRRWKCTRCLFNTVALPYIHLQVR